MPDLAWLDRQVRAILADRWSGSTLKHGLPRAAQLDTLPTAGAEYEGRIVYVSDGTDSHLYCCVLVASAFTWAQLD